MTLTLSPELCDRLLPWFAAHRRDLPWRRDREPYHVWISEIMLQQTRVEAVKGYYERFLCELPDVRTLAEAPEAQLLRLWEGLGYYSRVRNLQRAAKQIVSAGAFPNDYTALLALPGVGRYTAGAIGSICYELPTPAVDGNVLRVVSRLLALDAPVTDEAVRRAVEAALARIYPAGHCGDFTQALMELGATVCIPNGEPLCDACPIAALCRARACGTQRQYPKKAEKKPRRVERRTVFVLLREGSVAVCRRPERGLLAGLWQLPDVLGELDTPQALAQAESWHVHPTGIEKRVRRDHLFTHIRWEMTAYYLPCAEQGEFVWFSAEELARGVGLPTAYRQFLTDLISGGTENG